MNLIKFLELIKLRGNIEFLGAFVLKFSGSKLHVNFMYKRMLKVIAELHFNTDFAGNFCCTDIKELIKNLKSFKKEFKIKLDGENLICYNDEKEIKILGIKEELVLNKATEIENVNYTSFSKEQIKKILEFRNCMSCNELHIFSDLVSINLEAEDGEISHKEKIMLDKTNIFDIILGNEFLDILSSINNDCELYFENDKVFIKFEGENFKINYCLKGLKNE